MEGKQNCAEGKPCTSPAALTVNYGVRLGSAWQWSSLRVSPRPQQADWWDLGAVQPSAPGSTRRKTEGIAGGSLDCTCPLKTAWEPPAPYHIEGEVTPVITVTMTKSQ